MRWVLFPIDVVVIHAANHQCIGKRGRDWINLFSRADHRRWPATRDFIDHLERDLDVVLLISAKRAADGIEEKTFRLVHGILREMVDLRGGGQRPIFGVIGSFAATASFGAVQIPSW